MPETTADTPAWWMTEARERYREAMAAFGDGKAGTAEFHMRAATAAAEIAHAMCIGRMRA